MLIKLLKSVVENLINKQAVPIIDLLFDKKNVNEFLIAKKLSLTINQTRNILYKLSDFGLVSFIRKKDKRKGWYIYFWTLNIQKSLILLKQNLLNELNQFEVQLKNRQERRYYYCNTCSLEVNEESALLNNFLCPECEEVYQLSEKKIFMEQLMKNIERVKKDLEIVLEQLKIEEGKLEKKSQKKIKRIEKEKKAERKMKRDLRVKLNKKESKKNTKKDIKKKKKESKPKPKSKSKDNKKSSKKK